MNRKQREALTELYKAPSPSRKDEFLVSLPDRRIGLSEFLRLQLENIRPRVWILDLAVMLVGLSLSSRLELETIWVLSAFAPFFSLVGMMETLKSYIYNMDEFEMTTRFSLKSAILAKLTIFGLTDFLIIALLSLSFSFTGRPLFLRVGIYMYVPYLFTSVVSLMIVRRIHSSEAIHYCVGAAALVAGGLAFAGKVAGALFQAGSLWIWLAAFAVFSLILSVQVGGLIKSVEGESWSLT